MPWLLPVMLDRLADAARRYSRRGAHEMPVEQPDVTFSARLTNTEAEMFGDPEGLRKAIRELPHGQRQAIEMLTLGEMSLKEAATKKRDKHRRPQGLGSPCHDHAAQGVGQRVTAMATDRLNQDLAETDEPVQALAAAGLGIFGLRLFHARGASPVVLVWQFGRVFIPAALAGRAGRYVLNWALIVGPARRRVIARRSELVPECQ